MSVFAIAFTTPTWAKALVLLYGTILAPGRRTVTAALRAMGLADEKRFEKYHRVLNRDRWSPWVLSAILLRLIIRVCLPADAPLLLGVDETLERRWGAKIKYKQPHLAARLADPNTSWEELTVIWYSGVEKTLQFVTGTSLWHTPGRDPVPLRWVLVRCPEDTFRPEAFSCSDPTVTAEQILIWVIARWNIEVTFEEVRAHLGFGTQCQWADRAIERTTPCFRMQRGLAGLPRLPHNTQAGPPTPKSYAIADSPNLCSPSRLHYGRCSRSFKSLCRPLARLLIFKCSKLIRLTGIPSNSSVTRWA